VRGIDIFQLIPANTGDLVVVDVVHPEITGRVIVVAP
jgi:hypothetical protein